MSILINTYNIKSQSAKVLTESLKEVTVAQKISQKQVHPPKKFSLQVNWGCSRGNDSAAVVLNRKGSALSNKKTFSILLKNDLESSTYVLEPMSADKALKKLESGETVVGRSLLNASGGKGLHIIKNAQEFAALPLLPLYTEYLKKDQEFRCHFFRTSSSSIEFLWQKKKRLKSEKITENTFKIRNLANGWVYSTINFTLPAYVRKNIENKVVPAILKYLDFGAIDVIYNSKESYVYALEVNTAPGLSDTTLAFYKKNILEREGAILEGSVPLEGSVLEEELS